MNSEDTEKDDSNAEVCLKHSQINTIVLLAKSDCYGIMPNNEYCIDIETVCPLVQTYFISPNEFQFININLLAEYLSTPDRWSGIILTSKRCVDALIKSIELINNFSNDSFAKLIFFTVGMATKNYLFDKLNVDSVGYSSGNSETLAKFILDQHLNRNFTKPLLYPCSKIRSDPLMNILFNQIEIKELFCYDTIPNNNLDDNFKQFKLFLNKCLDKFLLNSKKFLLAIVFFSPSGVDNLWRYIEKHFLNDLNLMNNVLIKFIAFGKQTEMKMKSYNIDISFVVSAPNSQSLANDIKLFCNNFTNN